MLIADDESVEGDFSEEEGYDTSEFSKNILDDSDNSDIHSDRK